MYVMFGLLAVLFVSLGYLSMQGNREGLTITTEDKDKDKEDKPVVGMKPIIVQPFKGMEGAAGKKLASK